MAFPRLLLAAMLASSLRAAEPEEDTAWDARITETEGAVAVVSADAPSSSGIAAQADMPLGPGDRVRTGEGGRAEVALEADNVLELGPNTEFVLDSLERKDSFFTLSFGRLAAKIRGLLPGGNSLRVKTPTAVAAVRGTEFAVEVDDEGATTVGVFDEGKVGVTPPDGVSTFEETVLEPGQEARSGRRPDLEARGGRNYLRARRLDRLEALRPRMQVLQERREILRQNWRPLPVRERRELRRQLHEQGRRRQRMEGQPGRRGPGGPDRRGEGPNRGGGPGDRRGPDRDRRGPDPNGRREGPNNRFEGPNGRREGPNGRREGPNGRRESPNGRREPPPNGPDRRGNRP